jgi:hypothetical protein
MADEPIILPDAPHTPAGVQAHKCEHLGCSKWGGFGFTPGKSAPNVWFCFEHRGDGEVCLGRAQQ